ncbi:Sigma-70 region 4 type 2 [Haliscomenobacter hydrossis DSM 1100]|uniref:Sigma-70 region 4 type 2 n=1 Tax=Haliscomenobacter hydrossis (strain ATCC 27775 / DSM 1100 / LMG 10767 / O) TaxID=760192 RepID=F4L2L0_HALH1|nr:Sigma-70 region 4 type 2 [Haliscomenobacter hydrossis DSM 1100]
MINHFRRGKAQPQSDDLSLASELPGEAFDPATQQMVEYVQELIKTSLSEEDQLIMRLRAIEDYTYQEIADIMGMPIDTVSTRIHRARRILRNKI